VVTALVAAAKVTALVNFRLGTTRAGFGCSDFSRRTIGRFEFTLLRSGRRLNVRTGRE
jgi:hypothetical protein